MIKVHIVSGPIEEMKNWASGPALEVTQNAAIFMEGDAYPTKFVLKLAKGQKPYPEGNYELVGEFRAMKYAGLEFAKYVLKPIPSGVQK